MDTVDELKKLIEKLIEKMSEGMLRGVRDKRRDGFDDRPRRNKRF